ncbi:MAG: hypothetical protein SGILL_004089, partial [Bacillariaceae sp.]
MGPTIVMVLILFMAAIRLHTLVWSALESKDFHPQHGLFLTHPHHLREIPTTATRDVVFQWDGTKDLNSPTDIARVWPFAPDNHPWCQLTPQASSPPQHGLIYIKIDKASSSTLAGINIRLAHRIGARVSHNQDTTSCAHTYEHFHAWPRLSTGHDASQPTTLLWTFLREPAQRALSQYFHFLVSRQGYGATYMLLHNFLEKSKNFQLQYVMVPSTAAAATNANLNLTKLLHEVFDDTQTQQTTSLAFLDHFVMQQYNFIGLVERMEESLAVMKLLWNLEVGDLIVLSAKQSGGYDDGRHQNTCVKIVKPDDYFHRDPKGQQLYDRIQTYVEVDYRHNNLDYQLYQAVNASLDMTIDQLGRDVVDQT